MDLDLTALEGAEEDGERRRIALRGRDHVRHRPVLAPRRGAASYGAVA